MILAVDGGYTFGTLFGVPFLTVMLISGLGIGVLANKSSLRSDRDIAWAFFVGTPVVVLVVAVFTLWPFSKQYHYWQPVTGIVEQSDRRLVSDGKGMAEKIVVKFKDNPQAYGIEDTRAALLKPEDDVTLLCKRAYQWGPSVDGYDCRWGE